MKTFRLALAGALALAVAPAMAQVATAEPAAIILPQPSADYSYDRVVHLEGGQNFRDLGGYPAQDGRHVRWGLLYRSGSMYRLTPADFAYLDTLDLKTVVDFRSREERQLEPVNWPAGAAPRVLSVDYGFKELGMSPVGDPSEMGAMIVKMYPTILTQFNGQYRRMFAELLAGRAPLAFNCSAGRDRTGIAAALLLTALGVPRETIIQDYLLTNRYFDLDRTGPSAQTWRGKSDQTVEQMKASMKEVMRSTARPSIDAVFAVVDAHPGGAEGYLRDELGLGQSELGRLRQLYTE
ncbi:MAG TPA: tyrosine-protein phosphatase [Novosphingobium sp.]|nr:tyrosine-protein phosphatase [Novosphingobium sp.]